MRSLSLAEMLYLHGRILESSSGGGAGIRDLPMLESALAQPKQTLAVLICIRHWWRRPLSCASR